MRTVTTFSKLYDFLHEHYAGKYKMRMTFEPMQNVFWITILAKDSILISPRHTTVYWGVLSPSNSGYNPETVWYISIQNA